MTMFLTPGSLPWHPVASNFYSDELRQSAYGPIFYWDYRRRHFQAQMDGYGHFTLWTSSLLARGDASAVRISGYDICDGSQFEPFLTSDRGTVRWYYLRGQCKDNSSNPVPNAIVNCFRTSDNLFISQVNADAAGFYNAWTPYNGVNHYLEAYLAGAPDIAGTTVNTLTPAL